MKKLILLLLVFMFTQILNAQNVKETKIISSAGKDMYSLYDLKYDMNSGTYVYSDYDTVLQKYKLISNKGNSAVYSYTDVYNLFFDNSGNYLVTASNNISETSSKYFFLKNGTELKSFDNINFPVQKRDDGVYFIASENGKDYRVKYSFNSGEFEMGKGYDTIYTCFSSPDDMATEVSYEIGFTKDGRDFYIACSGGKQMMVAGSTEMKKYDEIVYRNAFLDNAGNICYTAKKIVNGKKYYCLVQNEKEYKMFADVTPFNIVFDKNNTPYYAASDEEAEYPSTQFLVKGSEIISKKFNRGIYNINISPSAKIAFIGTDTLKDGSTVTVLFVDGKEAARYSSIYSLKFLPDNSYIFIATDKDEKAFAVEGNKIVSGKYSDISNLEINKKGVLSYIATNYGDYEKNIPDQTTYIIGKEKHGPFKNLLLGEMGAPPIVFAENGDYVFTASQDMPVKAEERIKYFARHKDWSSEPYDYITDINVYKNDFYYAGNNSNDDGSSVFQLYKNNKKLGAEYQMSGNFKFDKEKAVITFNGIRENVIYFVEIKLND